MGIKQACEVLLSWDAAMLADRTFRKQDSKKSGHNFWVAVKELKLSYHNGYIYIYIANNRVSPI